MLCLGAAEACMTVLDRHGRVLYSEDIHARFRAAIEMSANFEDSSFKACV
jgi:hypothetical protein